MVQQTASSAFKARRRRRRPAVGKNDKDNDDEDDDDLLLPLVTRTFDAKGAVTRSSPRRFLSKRRNLISNVLGLSVILMFLLGFGMVLQGDFTDENVGRIRTLQLRRHSPGFLQNNNNVLSMTSNAGLKGTPLSQLSPDTFPFFSYSPTSDDALDLDVLFPDRSSSAPILHFVHTRFMQEQANLTALGDARLNLFEFFCLPTMVHQTTDNFFWIIRFDPDLDAAVFDRLWRLVHDNINTDDPQRLINNNIYLVASNHNFRINENFPGAWRDGAQTQDLAQSRIYSGDPLRLSTALKLLDEYLILETRLDADDGLHVDYLRTLQALASDTWGNGDVLQIGKHLPLWKYWCAGSHLEWHWVKPHEIASGDDKLTAERNMNAEFGFITANGDSQMCITPGITVAFPVGVREEDVPVFPHHQLLSRISRLSPDESCGTDSCLDFVQEHTVEAIRSRTPTSAGMLRIVHGTEDDQQQYEQSWQIKYALWNVVYEMFHISRVHIKWVQGYLTRHLYEIGLDNLHGQCTSGHSCKPEAKEDLMELLRLADMAKDYSSTSTGQ